MASVTATSQCPNCMGTLVFSPETGKLVCEFCESSFTPEEIEAVLEAKMQKASAAMEKEQAWQAAANAPDEADRVEMPPPNGEPIRAGEAEPELAQYVHSKWDASTIDEDWGEDATCVRTYSCASCGGEILCEETTGATQCPFCGNATIVPGQFSIGLKPNYVLPFKMTKQQAEEALMQHYRGKLFLPNEFTNKNQIKKLQGTYVPFWLFNGECVADVIYDCTRSSNIREGDYVVTTTEHYDVVRKGCVPFSKIPVDASTKMPDDMMDSLEPFDYSEMIPFTPAVFAGFIADKYDVPIDRCSSRADNRCESTVLGFFEDDIRGYGAVYAKQKDIRMDKTRVDYALLPIYTMKTEFNGKTYLFAMNGQTGKLVGDLPVSKKKFWGFCLGVTAALGTILFATGVGGAIADALWQAIAAV